MNFKFSSGIFFFLLGLNFISCKSLNKESSLHRIAMVKFAVTGDIMQHDAQIMSAWNEKCKCYDYTGVFNPVYDLLKNADITIGNLETTLPGKKEEYTGYPRFGAPDKLVTAIVSAGYDVLTTANNHCMDKGEKTVIRTLDVLDRAKLKHLGTYRSKKESEKKRILTIKLNGIRMALLNYTYGTNGIEIGNKVVVNLIDKDVISRDIQKAKENNPDVIIVLYHYGKEYLRNPDPYQIEYTNFAFQEGADIVLGGHPHVLQPFEIKQVKDKYGDEKFRLVIYSMGNFLSNQQRQYTDGGIVFYFSLIKEGKKIKISNINYEPVWVYIESTKSTEEPPGNPENETKHYHILPVKKYIENTGHYFLDPSAYAKMMIFYEDTTNHLRLSQERAMRF